MNPVSDFVSLKGSLYTVMLPGTCIGFVEPESGFCSWVHVVVEMNIDSQGDRCTKSAMRAAAILLAVECIVPTTGLAGNCALVAQLDM